MMSPGYLQGGRAVKVNNSHAEHKSVLAAELLEQITLPPDGVMVDATMGHGGHSYLFGQKLSHAGHIIGLDFDENSIRVAGEKLKSLACKVTLIQGNFADIQQHLADIGIEKVDFVLADLGFCSAQLEDQQLGLSFQQEMPLDMRLDKTAAWTAADIVNSYDEKSLADLIYEFGQERASRRIARFIVNQRQKQKIVTTSQLAAIIQRALPTKGRARIHPATRTFQALRIAVNNEMENLDSLLGCGPGLLRADGYIAIISFHSLEDRKVKYDFRENAAREIYQIVTKKPITPSREEVSLNKRARSAKLRIARRK